MNRLYFIVYLFALSFLLSNCSKSDEDIPQWLQDRIQSYEALADNKDFKYLEICEWQRYTYKKDYYFSFYNPIESSFPDTYDYEGVTLDDLNISYEEFYDESCCMKVIWRGSSF